MEIRKNLPVRFEIKVSQGDESATFAFVGAPKPARKKDGTFTGNVGFSRISGEPRLPVTFEGTPFVLTVSPFVKRQRETVVTDEDWSQILS